MSLSSNVEGTMSLQPKPKTLSSSIQYLSQRYAGLWGTARLVSYNNTTRSAIAILETLLEKPKVTFAIQRELVEDDKSLDQTEAGLFLMKDTDRKERQRVGTLNKRFDEISSVEIVAIFENMDHEHDREKLKELVASRDKLYKLQDELRDEMKPIKKDYDVERKLLRDV
jgi:hypothetical protein